MVGPERILLKEPVGTVGRLGREEPQHGGRAAEAPRMVGQCGFLCIFNKF